RRGRKPDRARHRITSLKRTFRKTMIRIIATTSVTKMYYTDSGIPQAEPDEFPDPAHQTPGRGADDARLHRARRSETAWNRARPAAAAADRRRIGWPSFVG